VARATRRILAAAKQEAEALTRRCVARVVDRPKVGGVALVRLRDWIMPVWAELYNANDVVTALKCTGLRHMARRDRLTRFVLAKLRSGELPHALPERLSIEERALYLQGVFFNTAVVQSSEALVHVLMALAQHERVQTDAAASPDADRRLERIIDETLRMYPLFGISHRITTADIALDAGARVPKGSVLCFNHLEYHRSGFADSDRFDPDRWQTLSPRDATYIPYGVRGNRPCPAAGVAPLTLRVATRELLARFSFHTSASHTRSIPNRGPCLVVSTQARLGARRRRAILLFVRVRDAYEDVWRSVVQLLFGSYMVWDARRQRPCARHFETRATTDHDAA
jgi:hypothetical protein